MISKNILLTLIDSHIVSITRVLLVHLQFYNTVVNKLDYQSSIPLIT